MDITRDPRTSPVIFRESYEKFFSSLHIPLFTTAEQAADAISILDQIVDAIEKRIKEEGLTYSEETILRIGSVIGEASKVCFNGLWYWSEKQGRWVIRYSTVNKDITEANVFRKVEKRFELGMEESIQQFFQMQSKIYREGADFMHNF